MANRLVTRMCLMYGPPETHDDQAWFAEMDRLVKSYSDKELDAAAEMVLRTHRGRGFPTVSQMLTACEDAREKHMPKPMPDPGYHEWSKARIAEADRLISCEMGRAAAREGWVFALHSFCRENRRLPKTQGEIGHCKSVASRFDAAYRDCVTGRGGVVGTALSRLGASMLERREELARLAMGDAP